MPRPDPCRACDDFHRTTEARRRRYLDGGRLTRRQLVGWGVGAGLAVYSSRMFSLTDAFDAAAADAAAAPNAPVLVSVFLPGGCDLLNTLVPLGQFGAYADLRPGLKLEGTSQLGSSGLGAHPELASGLRGGIAGLFAQQKVGFLPGIDYDNPDLSHFHSRHFWESGLITPEAATGWLGRYLDGAGSKDNPFQGLTMGYELSPVVRSGAAPVASLSSPDAAQLTMPGVEGPGFDRAMEAWERIASRGVSAPGPAAAQGAARLTKKVADGLKPYVSTDAGDPLAAPVEYPKEGDLAQGLRYLAALISLPLGIRVATVDADGVFDTHDNQPQNLTKGLRSVSQGLAAFQADLEARGVADRVLTIVWSEFGRRPRQNDSAGTDHGAGGVGWVQGTRARSGVLSEYPSLASFDKDDNLAVTLDFRAVYCSLLEQWLGVDAASVIPNASDFARVRLVK